MTLKVPPIYSYGFVDAAGVVASNNFLSVFNPSSSTVLHWPLETVLTCYSLTTAQVAGPMSAYRITAASGGTLVSAGNVNKYRTTHPASQCEVRIGNPTVTRVNSTPIIFKAPSVTTGGGNSGTISEHNPLNNALTLAPGEGLVFNTAQGSINSLWCLTYTWMEDLPQ